ncbi:MAG: hydrogenase maturation nickel metallochaperone HypA [Thermodesulfobacteriota bacterium]|nr:hydrogenase maturation nickel metallochaperone HypA [Thermodesulfobacteriota bacterium]
MHEMGIAVQIVEIAAASIPPDLETPSVERVNIKVGKLSAVIPQSLRFCFEIATKDTPLEGATLSIEEIPVTTCCKSCGHQQTITSPEFICESCGSGDLDILSGRELDIESIELAE